MSRAHAPFTSVLVLVLLAGVLCAGCARAKPSRVVGPPTAQPVAQAPTSNTSPTGNPRPTETLSPGATTTDLPDVTATPEPSPTSLLVVPPELVSTVVGPSPTPEPPGATEVPSEVTHVVQTGETLTAIASRYGTTVTAIMARNGLYDANTIYVGQALVVPTLQGAATPVAGQVQHTVAAGETLAYLARVYRTTVDEIMAANPGVEAGFLSVGQVLTVPVGTVPEARTHTVRTGETLYAIARQYGVEAAALVTANGLANPNTIYVGQVLVIP